MRHMSHINEISPSDRKSEDNRGFRSGRAAPGKALREKAGIGKEGVDMKKASGLEPTEHLRAYCRRLDGEQGKTSVLLFKPPFLASAAGLSAVLTSWLRGYFLLQPEVTRNTCAHCGSHTWV